MDSHLDLPPDDAEREELRRLARVLRGGEPSAAGPAPAARHAETGAGAVRAGESLRALLERRGTLAPRQALEIARQVLWRLEQLHGRGLVHGGLDLERVRLAQRVPWSERDPFGVGVLLAEPAGAPGADGGTRADDLFALALLLAELLLGTRLDPRARDWLAARAVVAGRDVRALLDRALAQEPARRFADAASFRAALERTPSWRGITPALRATRALLGLALLAALLLGGLFLRERAVVRAAHQEAALARACAALDRLLECLEEGDPAAAGALIAGARADRELAGLGFDSGFLEAALETARALADAGLAGDPAERARILDGARLSAERARDASEAFRLQGSAWLALDLPPRPARGRELFSWLDSLERDVEQRAAALAGAAGR